MLKLSAIGNLGNEPEMRYTAAGQPVTSFSVACSRKWKGADGTKHEETTWLRCSAWGKLAEVCSQYLKKGKKVYVEGRLNVDDKGGPKTFTRGDGTTGTSFELTVENIEFLSAADNTSEAAPQEQEEVIPL